MAHVIAVEGDKVWLEPEQTTSCGGCASSGACGAKGIGSVANRLEARRFQIINAEGLIVGERVVVGVREHALLRASVTAYVLPLAAMLGGGIVGQWAVGSDGVTITAMIIGLLLGLALSRLSAGRLLNRGDLTPHFLRRARPGENCHS
ncbi:MAG: SoxR reducing system RseC family protein [Pseudomonadota bacterium]